ncbi:MAG: transporter related [Mycobacterium sp.]|jgi:ABC-2 type transport system ATP-binding protein|nr:transporter related [Mycobacterium sp.]
MIEAKSLTKRYGDKAAVEDLTFTVQPGVVTGFLGPNGAGKSTTMRLIMGMDAPSSGTVTVNGLPFAQHARPLKTIGALLEARAIHPGRSARGHLLALAATAGIGRQRVDEVIGMAGLEEAAGQRAGRFSLGMGQRLGIAAALLADPETLILDEPVNGLDPDGIRWIRLLLRGLAAEGRTVLLSSHLMSEMALTADHVIVMGRGQLLRDQSMASFIADAGAERVRVRSPEAGALRELLVREGAIIHDLGEPATSFEVDGLTSEEIGTVAGEAGLTLYELALLTGSLEEAYMALTEDAVEYRAKEAATA